MCVVIQEISRHLISFATFHHVAVYITTQFYWLSIVWITCNHVELHVIKLWFPLSDAHTMADIDYHWKGGDSQAIEIVSKEMAQFNFTGVTTHTKSSKNSKGKKH